MHIVGNQLQPRNSKLEVLRETDRDRQTGRQAGRQRGRQTDRQREGKRGGKKRENEKKFLFIQIFKTKTETYKLKQKKK